MFYSTEKYYVNLEKLPKRKKKMLKNIGSMFYDLILENLGYVKEFNSLKEIYEYTHILLTFYDCNYYYKTFFTLIRDYQRRYKFDDDFTEWCSIALESMLHMKVRYEIFYKSLPDYTPIK